MGDVLNDHFLEIQTKLIPRSEYSDCNFDNIFSTLVFFEILFSIVSISSGSAAAKTIASISFSNEDNLVGKFITLSCFFGVSVDLCQGRGVQKKYHLVHLH